MWTFARRGLKAIAAGNTQASLGLHSGELPSAIVRIGRFLYVTTGLWIGAVWYTGYANARTQPGSGPQIVLPGAKVIGPPDRPNRSPQFTQQIAQGTAVPAASGANANSSQYVATGKLAGRVLYRISPSQIGVPGTAIPGYLWSAANAKKQIPPFNQARYVALLGVANKIANHFGLRITSGYRPSSVGSLHAAGLAFDMVGTESQMKRAATWAAQNPAMFQEIFIHNEGSGLHLHLGFYPDAAGIFNAATNTLKRPSARPQPSATQKVR